MCLLFFTQNDTFVLGKYLSPAAIKSLINAVANGLFRVHMTCEYCANTMQRNIQTFLLMLPRAHLQSQQISTLKKLVLFPPSHAVLILLTSKHLSLITPLLLSSPFFLSGCLYLSSHPPWCFSPSLQSMWLLRCLSICSPRQAQCAGATL